MPIRAYIKAYDTCIYCSTTLLHNADLWTSSPKPIRPWMHTGNTPCQTDFAKPQNRKSQIAANTQVTE